MKKLLIVLLLFICVGCTGGTEYTSNTSINEEKTLVRTIGYSLKIFRIGNHQYIEYYDDNRGSICHYEDCDYCKQHRGY